MIGALAAAVERLVEADPHSLADDESVLALHRLSSQLDAVTARATAAWEAARAYADEHPTAARWLSAKAHLALDQAHTAVRLGRACRVLPEAERAWLAGDITGRHVGLLASSRNDRTAARLGEDEAMLVDHARRLTHRGFTTALRYWAQLADPDGVEADAARDCDDRRLHLSQSWRDTWSMDGRFDPVGGAIVSNALRAIEQELFEVDRAEAKARLGDEVTVADLARTPAQRRADAMVELATRAMASRRHGRRPAPLFTVLVGYETLHGRVCELANGTVVTPGALVPWLDQAMIERAVFRPPQRVECSARSRLFTGATLRGLQVRDRSCRVEGCDDPAETGQADHVVPYALGGPTTQDNGRILCAFHNRLRHRRQRAP